MGMKCKSSFQTQDILIGIVESETEQRENVNDHVIWN